VQEGIAEEMKRFAQANAERAIMATEAALKQQKIAEKNMMEAQKRLQGAEASMRAKK